MKSISFAALELVLEEIHLQRRARLREWQESDICRNRRIDDGLKFSDDFGAALSCLSLVHPTWTSVARRTLGRILVFLDVTIQSAKAAASTPIFGLWTREVYLPFSRDYSSLPTFRSKNRIDDSEFQLLTSTWNCIAEVLARTPDIITLCLQTAADRTFNIYRCVEKLCDVLPKLGRLRTLRLYSDVVNGLNGDAQAGFSSITEIPSFFHALEDIPSLECLMLRHYIPCFQLFRDARIKIWNSYSSSLIPYEWLPDSPPDPYVVTRIVGDPSSLTGRIRSLADLIRSICNTPAQMDDDFLISIAHYMEFIAFKFNSASQQFVADTAMIGELAMECLGNKLTPSLEFPKWCSDVEFLQLLCPHDIAKRLSPFPSLKVLQILVATSYGASPEKMLDEVRWFVHSLPPNLEYLTAIFAWETLEEDLILPLEMHDEFDELLATIPTLRCPNIKGLIVDLGFVSKLFRTEYPLKLLIDSCEKRKIPLILFPYENTQYYGQCSRGFKNTFMIEHFID